MARIPTLSDTPRVSPRPSIDQTISPGEAGAPYRQLAQVSGKIGNQLMALRNKQIAEADKVAYSKSNIEISKSFNDIERDMDTEYREGKPNFDGYANDGLERLTERRDTILEQSPETARDQINLSFDQKFVGMEQRLRSKEANQKSQYAMYETKDQIRVAAQDANQTYNPTAALGTASQLSNLVNTSAQFDARGKEVLNSQIRNLPSDMLEGVLSRGSATEMSQALRDMDDETLSPVFGGLSSKESTRYKGRIQNKLKYKETESVKEVQGRYSDAISALNNGTLDPTNPTQRQLLTNVKNDLVTRLGEEGREFVANIETQEKTSSLLRESAFTLAGVDPAASGKLISEDIKDPLQRAAAEGRSVRAIATQKQMMIKEMEKDPASYIAKYDPSVALSTKEIISSNDPRAFTEYMNSMDSHYDQMGIQAHQRQYLNSSLKEHYGSSINKFIASKDAKSASAILGELSQKSGGELYRFYDELDIPKQYAAVSEIEDDDARMRVMSNIMNEKEDINPRYAGVDNKLTDDKIKTLLRSNPMYAATIGQDAGQNTSSGRNAEALLKVAQVEYKSAILNGEDQDDAERIAWERVSKSYNIVENGNFPIPVRSKYQSDKVSSFLENNTKVRMDYVNKFKLNVPEGTRMKEMNESLESNSFWTYNKKSDSLRLLYYNKSQARYQEARKMDGSPVLMTLDAINKMDFEEGNKRLEVRKNIFSSALQKM